MATKTSHLVRPLLALVALVAAMAALLIVYGASPTHAAGSCSTTSGTTTCTFGPTGKEDTFVVPAGVNSIHVVATGAHGGDSNEGGAPGGRGAQVSGDLTVTPGQTLYVNVGTNGRVGGFNGGGSSDSAGDGGGASDVRTISRVRINTLFSRLIVAGGGGGAGDIGDCGRDLEGAGGDAGSGGGDGKPCPPAAGGGGGGAGTQTAGGAGGTASGSSIIDIQNGQDGVLGQGGTGGSVAAAAGGGGGGGLFGGGGGGGADDTEPDGVAAGAGGGGGGSNLVPEGGTATLDDSGNPSIVISYQGGLGEEPPTEPEDKQACKKGGWKELGFKNQGQCIKAVNANN
jgi:hypothetical protein